MRLKLATLAITLLAASSAAAQELVFGNWTPASTTVCVNQLSTPGARVELDMIAVFPKPKG